MTESAGIRAGEAYAQLVREDWLSVELPAALVGRLLAKAWLARVMAGANEFAMKWIKRHESVGPI